MKGIESTTSKPKKATVPTKQGKREFKMLKKTDKHLIGKTLLFRDPGKCGCKDGICKTCYGALATVNKGMDVGIFASTIISRPLSQNILSTKHLNTTDSCLIEFNDCFDKSFKLEEIKDSEIKKYYDEKKLSGVYTTNLSYIPEVTT